MVSVSSETNDFNGILAFIGGFALFFGLVSFVIKQRLFLADSLVATVIGILFGPLVIKLINPFAWPAQLHEVILHFSDLVINIQIMAAAVTLPRKFWTSRWKALLLLVGPVTLYMWLVTAVIFWQLLRMPWLEAMILAACAAPTDPVLANSIVNGRFADLYIHNRLRQLLSGESAINDGAALPFFYLGVFLIKYPAGMAIGKWVYEIWLYEAGVAIVFGAVFGYFMRVSLKYCEENDMIDKNSFFVFELALAFFTMGIAGIFHFSSFIATFATGVAFSWDGWFAKETEEAHVQEVLDMLVNIVFFMFFGASIPWASFNTERFPIWRLIVSSILVLIVRRLPAIIALSRHVCFVLTWQETFFVGWFGPVGVGALWYMALAIKIFPEYSEEFMAVMYFIVLSSVLVHGIMVPFVHVTMVGIRTRTMSTKSAAVEVPMWPAGVPITVNVISGPMDSNGAGSSTPTIYNHSDIGIQPEPQMFTVRSLDQVVRESRQMEYVAISRIPTAPGP